jgi:hypothetical protein
LLPEHYSHIIEIFWVFNMSEIHEQIKVCGFLKDIYPGLIFYSDLSGLKFAGNVARLVKLLRSSNGFTDLFIFKPVGRYHGLFIELKETGKIIYNKNGSLRKDEHLQEQADMIRRLNEEGYYATFAIGQEAAIKVINDYINKKI